MKDEGIDDIPSGASSEGIRSNFVDHVQLCPEKRNDCDRLCAYGHKKTRNVFHCLSFFLNK